MTARYLQLFVYQLNIRIYHNHALGLLARCPGVHGEDFKKNCSQFAHFLLNFMAFGWTRKDGVGDDNDTEFGVEF